VEGGWQPGTPTVVGQDRRLEVDGGLQGGDVIRLRYSADGGDRRLSQDAGSASSR
jgi:hypothetical protein